MLEGFEHTLARHPVQRSKQEHIEFSLTRVSEHGLELAAVVILPGFVVHVFAEDGPALRGRKLAKLAQLVFDFLAFVLGC